MGNEERSDQAACGSEGLHCLKWVILYKIGGGLNEQDCSLGIFRMFLSECFLQ